MDLVKALSSQYMKEELPEMRVGDTVRRISYGVGCEKVFPVHSPRIANVETVRKGKVRRAKLYYLRERFGKAAKIKEKV